MKLLFDADADAAGEGAGGGQGEGFEATRDILVRLTSEYDEQQRGAEAGGLDEFSVVQALEYRHRATTDGRLALWREEHVRALLLEWLPRNVTVLPQESDEHDAPGAVATLVEFLAVSGLLDSRSDDPGRLRDVAESLRQAHTEAHEDPRLMGPATFWMLTAARSGVDVRDERALERFLADVRAGRVGYDEAVLAEVMTNQFLGGLVGSGPGGHSLLAERMPPLPVVDLGGDEVLREAAAGVDVLGQLAEVARWLGKEGRPLTRTGRLQTADALELARHLGTDRGLGEAAGPLNHLAGDDFRHIRRADQLPYLRLLVDWAREARLVRVYGGCLVAVAGARTVREDPLALAARALTALPALRDPLLAGPESDTRSPLYPCFDLLLTDVLAALYAKPVGTPWPMLWHAVCQGELYDGRQLDGGADIDSPAELRVVLDLLVRTGVIVFERGPVDASVLEGLRSLAAENGSSRPATLPGPGGAARLHELLRSCEGDDVELLRLTPLGTYAVRASLTTLGRSAPALGELRTVDATTLLATLHDEYDDQHTSTELAGWVEAAGGWDAARPALADALQRVHLHARRNSLLRMLVAELPDGHGPDLLRWLRTDPDLAPSALLVGQEEAAEAALVRGEAPGQDPDDDTLDDREYALAVAESLLLMWELDGENGLLEGAGRAGADAEALITMLRVARTSGHPDISGLERLAGIDVAALRRRSAQLGRLRAAAARKRKSDSAKKKGRGKKRR